MSHRPSASIGRALSAIALVVLLAACSKAKLNNSTKAAELAGLLEVPEVLSVYPPSGLVAGGTVLTILGKGFKSGSSVSLGTGACLNVIIVSETEISCTTPAYSAGLVDVGVTSPNGKLGQLAGSFLYIIPVPQRAGTAITSGGRVATGGAVQIQAAMGEIGSPNITSGAAVQSLTGVHGAIWQP